MQENYTKEIISCLHNKLQNHLTLKTKAFGLCGTLAIATALLIGAGAVSADETTQPVADTQPAVSNVYTADNGGNVTVTPSETVAPAEPTPVTETPVADATSGRNYSASRSATYYIR